MAGKEVVFLRRKNLRTHFSPRTGKEGPRSGRRARPSAFPSVAEKEAQAKTQRNAASAARRGMEGGTLHLTVRFFSGLPSAAAAYLSSRRAPSELPAFPRFFSSFFGTSGGSVFSPSRPPGNYADSQEDTHHHKGAGVKPSRSCRCTPLGICVVTLEGRSCTGTMPEKIFDTVERRRKRGREKQERKEKIPERAKKFREQKKTGAGADELPRAGFSASARRY